MKRSLLILFSFSFWVSNAQPNLVPNYSFEQKLKCVNNVSEFTGYTADWSGQGSRGGGGLSWMTAQCLSSGMAGVPDNELGHQNARSGNSYAAVLTFLSYYNGNWDYYDFRDYPQVNLTNTLVAGEKYCVIFYVSLGDTMKYACSDIGAYFSDSALYSSTYCQVKSYITPQVANDPISNPLTNKVNWTKVSGTFIAKGGEKYIVIGNFKDDAYSAVDSVGSRASNSMSDAMGAIYYLDDVSVRQISQAHTGAFKDTLICNGHKVLIGQDTGIPGVSYHWLPTAGLSNPNAPQTLASPSVTTTYTLTVVNDSIQGCNCPDSISTDSVTVSVYDIPMSVCCPANITNGQSIVLNATPSYRYIWVPNAGLDCDTSQSILASPLTTTIYTITETDSEGCMASASVEVTVDYPYNIFIPNAFSPNGDGQNDILLVKGSNVATFNMIIYDRWGNKVFESSNINTGWDGTYNGKPQEAGTYVYYASGEYTDKTAFSKKGNIALVR
jgi:gliding motility-associated-like protein